MSYLAIPLQLDAIHDIPHVIFSLLKTLVMHNEHVTDKETISLNVEDTIALSWDMRVYSFCNQVLIINK